MTQLTNVTNAPHPAESLLWWVALAALIVLGRCFL